MLRPVVILAASLVASALAQSPDTYLTAGDRQRLQSVLAEAAKGGDAVAAAHAALALKSLGSAVPDQQGICKKLMPALTSQDLPSVAVVARAGEALHCGLQAPADVTDMLKKAATGGESAADVHQAFSALSALKAKPDSAATLKALTVALKKDDSLANLGHALKLAASLDGDVKAVSDRASDAFVQADEVDGRMLQFEGGLSVTSLILTGAYQLATKTKAAPPISKEKAVKFANYVLSRKSVRSAEGVKALIEALIILSDNPFHVPVSITLDEGSSVVRESSPNVRVRVTNLLGQSLGKMALTVDSATRSSDGAVVLSKSKMAAVAGDDAAYEVDMIAAKPARGFYDVKVTAAPAKADARLTGHEGAVLRVKALGSAAVANAEIGVTDADQSTAPKLTAVEHPKKLSAPLDADHRRKVVFKFVVKDKESKDNVRVHQAFVRLVHAKSNAEIVFVAEPDSGSVYTFELDVGARADDFGGRSGDYAMHLVVGDAVITEPVDWHVADLKLTFPVESEVPYSEAAGGSLKPAITHL